MNKFIKFEVEVERSIMWLLISLGHVAAEVLDEITGFLKVFQLFLVLLAQVHRAVRIVGCTKFTKIHILTAL